MDEDPILKELHEAKDKLGRKYGLRVEVLGRALMRKQGAAPPPAPVVRKHRTEQRARHVAKA